MKTKLRYFAPVLSAVAIGTAIGAAPVAMADPGSVSAPETAVHLMAAGDPAPTTSPQTATAPNPYQWADPLVPANTGADPFVFVPPGYGLPS